MPRDSHFEKFRDHTRVKHFLLDTYLKRWATILINGLKRPGWKGPRLWFVDAFAGAGRDLEGTPGSPLIAAEIANATNAQHFGKPLSPTEGMRVVAVEVDPRRHELLEKWMQPFREIAEVHPGTLQPLLGSILARAGSDPIFFFLDPFGVGGLDASMLPRLLAGTRTEILLLFADEGAVRLAGKAGAQVPDREELLAQRSHSPSILGEEYDAMIEEADRAAIDRMLAGHQSNPRAEEILDTAFGRFPWRQAIERTPPDARRSALVDLYEEVLRNAGAIHVLRFAVTTSAGRHKYTLLHASKHKRAYATMKYAIDHTERKHLEEPLPLLEMFAAADPEFVLNVGSGVDIELVADAVGKRFAGKKVRWKGKRYSDEAIERFVIDETPTMPSDLPALQRELERRGWAVTKPARPRCFQIPPGPGGET